MTEDWKMVLSAKHFFLPPYDRHFDAGSFYGAFLTALFVGDRHDYPNHVDIMSFGQHFAVSAEGWEFKVDLKSLPSKLDILNYRRETFQQDPPLSYLKPLVWFSEHCFIDITNSEGSYRQAFMNGKPHTQPTFSNSDYIPGLSVHFTLPAEMFDQRKLAFSRCKKVIREWQKRDFAAIFRTKPHPPTLSFRWLRQDDYYYSLRINVINVSDESDKPDTAQDINQLSDVDK
jgi:hypothetical protein